MNILILADIDDLRWTAGTGKVDLVLALGDTVDCLILEAAAAYQCNRIYAVKGNHDPATPFPKPIVDLDIQTVEFGGLTFGGLSGSWKYKPAGHFLYEQEEVDDLLAGFPKVDVFISHNSPLSIHDKPDGIHTGFSALLAYVQRQQPHLLIHGHQHRNIETMVGRTRVLGVYGHQVIEITDTINSTNGIKPSRC